MKVYSERLSVGWKVESERSQFKWLTFKEMSTLVNCFGNAVTALDCMKGENKFVAICAKNRPEWFASILFLSFCVFKPS